jgi:hypothetical protein
LQLLDASELPRRKVGNRNGRLRLLARLGQYGTRGVNARSRLCARARVEDCGSRRLKLNEGLSGLNKIPDFEINATGVRGHG